MSVFSYNGSVYVNFVLTG